MISTKSFPITYTQDGITREAQVQPCCREDNIVDYAVYQEGRLVFTIAHDPAKNQRWVIAMKNADDEIPDAVVQAVGAAIDNKIKTS